MKKFEEIKRVYLLFVKKHHEQGLSKEEVIAKHSLSWVLGYSIINPFDFVEQVSFVDLREERKQ